MENRPKRRRSILKKVMLCHYIISRNVVIIVTEYIRPYSRIIIYARIANPPTSL